MPYQYSIADFKKKIAPQKRGCCDTISFPYLLFSCNGCKRIRWTPYRWFPLLPFANWHCTSWVSFCWSGTLCCRTSCLFRILRIPWTYLHLRGVNSFAHSVLTYLNIFCEFWQANIANLATKLHKNFKLGTLNHKFIIKFRFYTKKFCETLVK